MRGKVEGFSEKLIHDGKKIAIYGTSPCGRLTQKALENLGGGDRVIHRSYGAWKLL